MNSYLTLQKSKENLISRIKKYILKTHDLGKSLLRNINDFPEINKFISDRFPTLSLENIPIYIFNEEVMIKGGFKGINGAFFPDLNYIICIDKPNVVLGKGKGIFFKMLHDTVKKELNIDDIVVHELMHAVSANTNRVNRVYKNNEEEFVFTNCIDFYKSKGMTDEDISESILMAFFLNEIMETKKHMVKLFQECDLSIDCFDSNKEYLKQLNKNADKLVSRIVMKSKENSKHMIECYYKNNSNTKPNNIPIKNITNSRSLRFKFLDTD